MKTLLEGLFKQNPVFVLLLGLVPAVAAAATAGNGFILGLISTIIMLVTVVLNYLFNPLLPENVRPIVTAFVLIVLVVFTHGLLLSWNPQIVAQLGIFLPLIAVTCFLPEDTNEKDNLLTILWRTFSQGLGFILALVVIGVIREFLSLGTIFGSVILKGSLPPLALAGSVPGGLIVVGLLLALVNWLTGRGGELHD